MSRARLAPLPLLAVSSALLMLSSALLMACSDDAGNANDEVGIDDESSSAESSESESATSLESGSSTDESAGCEVVCGADCCEADEVCNLDSMQCVLDCGDTPVCGSDPGACCDAGEVCYVGACIVPGNPCEVSGCATDVRSDCPLGEVCDGGLGACVPDLADPTCTFTPEAGVFDPVPRFSWGVRKPRACTIDADCQNQEVCTANNCEVTWPHVQPADDDAPTKVQSVGTPVVGDLDGDCIPEIVFNSFEPPNYLDNGILRAIRGDDGSKLWTLDDPMWETDSAASPAIGDLDYDGIPEIITPGEGNDLIAIAADGTPLWKSDPYTGSGKSGAASLANFDLGGHAEVAYGRTIYDSAGKLVFEGASGQGNNGSVGKLSCVADLDNDFRPELIAGGTVYTFTGTVGVDFQGSVLWNNADHGGDGYCGVADLDLDGSPEVIVVRSGWIDVIDGVLGTTRASIQIPGGGAGGPPNIANFDGDPVPEIGTAGGAFYVVVEWDGMATMTQLWSAATKDGSSSRTGSSVFDFDGDGRSEVIYFDEWYLRIYPGIEPDCALDPQGPLCDGNMTDAEILFIDINSSQTRAEYPIVADVDGDFKAEIIVPTNNWSGQGDIGDAGIEVIEDRLDNWVATLPIWNQHTYHVTNVDAKAGIPINESPNWDFPANAPYNSYRRNTQGGIENCAPDLVAQDLENVGPCTDEITLRVRVCNQGCLGVGPGVEVSFSEQDAGLLGTVVTTKAIPAGTCDSVELTLPAPGNPPYAISVSVDDDGMGMGALNECNEANNVFGPSELCPNIG